VPLTLVLLILSKAVLHLGSRNISYDEVIYANHEKKKPHNFGKQMTFAAVNIGFMFVLSGLQFMIQPKPALLNFNIIDLVFLVYLGAFVIYAFIIPTQDIRWKNVFKNLSYFIIFILLFPLIAVIETIREVRQRFRLRGETLTRELDTFLLNVYGKIWKWLHRERKSDIKSRHTQQLVSINRLIYDLPFFGLFFVALVLGIIYLLFRWGDNPATAVNDGHIFVFLKEVLSGLLLSRQTVFTVFLMTVTISIFLSEVINNATVIIIMLPIVLNLTDLINLNPLILLLAVTLGATAVFMSPLGTNINALAFASFERVRLFRMMVKGFLLNLLSLGWITIFLYMMHLLLTKAPILG
jgi:sodium-dependent dicarboxylate transporter 2/3/5